MDLAEALDQLEAFYMDDPDENKAAVIGQLYSIHEAWRDDTDSLNEFVLRVISRCDGVYIPYVFWAKLNAFLKNQDERIYLYEIIKAFASSSFEEAEQMMMKPLLITYFSQEKEFEIHKLQSLIFDKAHHTVRDYFNKLVAFVQKNEASRKMYREKFELCGNRMPDFELFSLPITQLREEVK